MDSSGSRMTDDAPTQVPGLVSVIMLNHNGRALQEMMRRSANAVLHQENAHVELIMVDDNSTDESDRFLSALCVEIGAKFVSTRNGRHGICAARNAAVRVAQGEYIAFMDNDAEPANDQWVSSLVQSIEADPKIGACSSRSMYMDKHDVINALGSTLCELLYGTNIGINELEGYVQWPEDVMYATGNGMFLRRAAMQQVGEFDEGFRAWGADDADYGLRLHRAGWRVVSARDSVLYHVHNATRDTKGMPFWDGRNRLRMALKHQYWRELPVFLHRDVSYLKRLRIKRGDYLRYWTSVLFDPSSLFPLLAYRWRHRGEPAFAAFFAPYLQRPYRYVSAWDNRPYGRSFAPLSQVYVGINDEEYLYSGWYWVDYWGSTVFRWALRAASIIGTLQYETYGLRWQLVPRPYYHSTQITIQVQLKTDAGYEEVTRLQVDFGKDPGQQVREFLTPCHLQPGNYRFVLIADDVHTEPGFMPRQIGFGFVGMQVIYEGQPAASRKEDKLMTQDKEANATTEVATAIEPAHTVVATKPGGKRILQVVHAFMPESVGGTEVYTYLLSRCLQKQHDLAIYYRVIDYSRPDHELTAGIYGYVPVYRLVNNFTWSKGPDFDYFDPGQEAKFEAVLDDFKPDMVHFEHLGGGLSTSLPSIVKRRGIPMVLTLHDFWELCYRSHLQNTEGQLCPGPEGGLRCAHCWSTEFTAPLVESRQSIKELGLRKAIKMAPRLVMERLVQREYIPSTKYSSLHLATRDGYFHRLLNQFDLIMSPSEFLRQEYIAWGIAPERIRFIQNGIDAAKLGSDIPDLPMAEELTAVYTGQLIWHKGLDVLIDAFNQLVGVPVKLDIYGGLGNSPEALAYTKSLRSRNNNPRVAFRGPFPNQVVGKVLATADMMIVPSIWYENCPMTILESLYMRRPVITSNVGGMAELIKDGVNGLTFRIGDANHLAERIRYLAENRDVLKRMHDNIVPPNSIETVAATVESCYEEVWAKRSR